MNEKDYKELILSAVMEAAKEHAEENGYADDERFVYRYLNEQPLMILVDGIYRNLSGRNYIIERVEIPKEIREKRYAVNERNQVDDVSSKAGIQLRVLAKKAVSRKQHTEPKRGRPNIRFANRS